MAFLSVPNIFSLAGPSIPTRCSTPSAYQHSLQLKSSSRLNLPALCTSYEVGAAFLAEEFGAQNGRAENPGPESGNFDSSQYEVILKGGEQVTSVLEEMAKLLEDMKMDEASEEVAVQLAAQGVIGKRVDEMESGFMMALDYMIQTAEKDQDDKRKSLLEVIKETVLSHLTKKCPPHVQVIGLLCRTPQKESRHELLRRVAAGGGVFQSENGTKVHLPGANLNDIANQADDILEESNYYLMNRSHIPAFGSWESCNTDEFPIPFTQCFESARQVDLRRYSYSEDRDLYVAGDLYQNDILTPAMIVVPRRKRKTSNEAVGKEGRKEGWVVCNYEYDEVKKAVSPVPPSPSPPKRAAKAVDEDLYKISPQLLYAKPKRKGIRGFFSMCLPPTCAS